MEWWEQARKSTPLDRQTIACWILIKQDTFHASACSCACAKHVINEGDRDRNRESKLRALSKKQR